MTDDKDYKTHTNLVELKALVASSKEGTDMSKAKKGKAGGKTTGPKYAFMRSSLHSHTSC